MKKSKKLILLVVTILLLSLAMTTSVFASDIKVTINNTYLNFEQPPVVEKGRTLVPLRAIFEALGAKVDWEDSTRTITGTKDSTVVRLQLGNSTATVNGTNITLQVPATSVNGRTVVPTRFIAESLGANVDWDGTTRTVIITTGENIKEPTPQPTPEPAPIYLGRININTASLQELQEIIHINEVRSKQLVELRPFTSINDLTKISGIADVRLKDIIEQGKAYVD
ncbi:copper amine oxidase domain protein [Alkaliphilus metalliredigens QYMF]|uniref:Copper amine oxidase domain protein n=1 Tax=Alkaliphilus metalliredigens (strain QYMF) TaxID=293826 RepID=A6TLR7_ALKMQ|nr:stalk domain-containing protein [Alkaliphilus metalliredigens]ABR47135.1 copper amine oxidase domain protein [Alkaliphilus metalliredigens QYMF]